MGAEEVVTKCGTKWSSLILKQDQRRRDESKLGKHEIL
jgi:hypothetical protein